MSGALDDVVVLELAMVAAIPAVSCPIWARKSSRSSRPTATLRQELPIAGAGEARPSNWMAAGERSVQLSLDRRLDGLVPMRTSSSTASAVPPPTSSTAAPAP
ncbi:MAG: hypothetical protein U5Q44_06980 [Dehalococcoidia bacterium]|nr:hypothetical protein [Dehalococcoidia bacterium]